MNSSIPVRYEQDLSASEPPKNKNKAKEVKRIAYENGMTGQLAKYTVPQTTV